MNTKLPISDELFIKISSNPLVKFCKKRPLVKKMITKKRHGWLNDIEPTVREYGK